MRDQDPFLFIEKRTQSPALRIEATELVWLVDYDGIKNEALVLECGP